MGCGGSKTRRVASSGQGFTWPLANAMAEGNLTRATKLVEKGNTLPDSEVRRWTPIHKLAGESTGKDGDEAWNIVVASCADVNALDSYGITDQTLKVGAMLHYAVQAKHLQRVKELLDKGASINNIGKNGTTPLILAAYSQDMGILQLLLTRGAVVKMRNKSGINPLIAAASIGWTDGVRALLQKGASITSNSRQGALHAAAAGGHKVTVKALLNAGAKKRAKIELQDGRRVTAFDLAGKDNPHSDDELRVWLKPK